MSPGHFKYNDSAEQCLSSDLNFGSGSDNMKQWQCACSSRHRDGPILLSVLTNNAANKQNF